VRLLRASALLSALTVSLLLPVRAIAQQNGAGAPRLALTVKAPVVDGVVMPGEYSFTKDSGDLVLSASRSADTLWLAVTGQTTGWVGVGVGALQMDGATIFMGYVDDHGKVTFKPQAGQPDHTHSDTTPAVLATVVSYALTEVAGITTLEVALKAAPYIAAGQKELDVIFAVGPADNFTDYHLDRDFVSLSLDSP
jgi:hypothetical protein